MARHSYGPPIDSLFDLEPPLSGTRVDYMALGVGPEHVESLVGMATDPELLWAEVDTSESWAPVHPWRALGQLRAFDAVEPLVGLLSHAIDDDWILLKLPRVFESSEHHRSDL